MSSNVSKPFYRGIVPLDDRFNFDAIQPIVPGSAPEDPFSNYSQAGAKPGTFRAIDGTKSAIRIQAGGSILPLSPGLTFPDNLTRLWIERGGYPLRPQIGVTQPRPAGFIYQDAGARVATTTAPGTTNFGMGWDVPNAMSRFEWLDFTTSPTTSNQPYIIRLTNGDGLLCHRRSAATNPGIRVRRFLSRQLTNGGLGQWSAANAITVTSPDWPNTSPTNLWPCMVEIPLADSLITTPDATGGGTPVPRFRVLMFYWVRDLVTDRAQIQMQYSDDGGQTWTLGSRFCLRNVDTVDTSNFNLGPMSVAYSPVTQQILLVAQITDPTPPAAEGEALVQFASSDLGTTFTKVYQSNLAANDNGATPSVLPLVGGGFFVMYNDTLVTFPAWRRISSAFQSLGDVPETSITTAENIDWQHTWEGEDKTFYMAVRIPSTGRDVIVYRSADQGTTWARMESSTGTSTSEGLWRSGQGANSYMDQFVAAEISGTTIMSFIPETSTGTTDNALGVLYVGGHTDLTMPAKATFVEDADQMAWVRTYVPTTLPTTLNNVWAETVTGTGGAVALTSSGLQMTATAGNTRLYRLETASSPFPPSTLDREFVARIGFRPGTWGTTLAEMPFFEVVRSDGAQQFRALVVFAGPDVIGPGVPGGVVVYDPLDPVFPAAGSVRGLRVVNWSAGAEMQVLVSTSPAVGSPATMTMTVMCLTGPGGNTGTVNHEAVGADKLRRRWVAVTGDGSVMTRSTVSPPVYTDVRFGFESGGVGVHTFTHACYTQVPVGVRWHPGVAANRPRPFPRYLPVEPVTIPGGLKVSAVDGPALVNESFGHIPDYEYGLKNAMLVDSPSPQHKWRTVGTGQQQIVWDMNDTRRSLGTTLALGLFGCNWRKGSLWVGNGVNPWVKLFDIDMASGTVGLPYLTSGGVFVPDLATPSPAGVPWFDYGELVGDKLHFELGFGSSMTTIKGNDEGQWTNLPTKRPTIQVGPPTLSPIAVDTPPNTLAIVRQNAVFLIHNLIFTSRYIRLQIDAQDTPEGYLETGGIGLGSVSYLSRQYSRGRSVEVQTGDELLTRRDGTRASQVIAKPRRVYEVQWQEGIDTTAVSGTGNQPPYIQVGTSPTTIVGAPAGTPGQVQGLLGAIGGSDTLCLYLPKIEAAGNAVKPIMSRRDFALVRCTSLVRTEAILGDESQSEVVRMGSLVMEEEI
jgi:hypothetical protein